MVLDLGEKIGLLVDKTENLQFQAGFGSCDYDNPSPMAYWNKMFPNMAMPNPVLQSLPKMKQDDMRPKTFAPNHFIVPQAYGAAVLSTILDEESVGNRGFFLKKNLVVDSEAHFTVIPNDKCKVDPEVPSFAQHQLRLSPSPSPSPSPSASESQLFDILRTYSVDENSITAKIIKLTIERCASHRAVNGRIQSCEGSFEGLLNLVTSSLGDPAQIKAISRHGLHADSKGMYKFSSIRSVGVDDTMLICHKLTFPVALFHCHQTANTTGYLVSLQGVDSGIEDEVGVVCHEDTSQWNARYIAFIKLGVKPGTPVCHLLDSSDVLWFKDQNIA